MTESIPNWHRRKWPILVKTNIGSCRRNINKVVNWTALTWTNMDKFPKNLSLDWLMQHLPCFLTRNGEDTFPITLCIDTYEIFHWKFMPLPGQTSPIAMPWNKDKYTPAPNDGRLNIGQLFPRVGDHFQPCFLLPIPKINTSCASYQYQNVENTVRIHFYLSTNKFVIFCYLVSMYEIINIKSKTNIWQGVQTSFKYTKPRKITFCQHY